MAEPARWYVVHTYSGYENKVMTNLEKTVENRKLHDLIQDVRQRSRTTRSRRSSASFFPAMSW